MQLKDFLKPENTWAIVNVIFQGIDLTKHQVEIVRSIAFKEHKRVIVSCYTRYGKTFCVAIGILLFVLFNPGKRVRVIAPLKSQSLNLRNYLADLITRSPTIAEILDIDRAGNIDRIKKEVSKSRLTFKNGCEISFMSAEGKATRLMGFGGDLIVLDESCLIDEEVYRQKIRRMLGDDPEKAILVHIGNPWHKRNHFWQDWISPDFHKIHIDYKIGIQEGRTTQEWIEEERSRLTPLEFQVLYEARFPDEAEDQLISERWINAALEKQTISEEEVKKLNMTEEYIAGLDIAEAGKDLSVMIVVRVLNKAIYEVVEIKSWHKADTMVSVSNARTILEKYELRQKPIKELKIDAIGLGKGVADRMQELYQEGKIKTQITQVKVGMKPTTKQAQENYLNQKAEFYFRLAKVFEEEKIKLPKDDYLVAVLVSQLLKMRWEFTSNRKIRIIDPEDKSPDYADALMLALSQPRKVVVL